MRQDQSFPAHLESKKCDTFEGLWGDFSENWSKIGAQTAEVRIVLERRKEAKKTQRCWLRDGRSHVETFLESQRN